MISEAKTITVIFMDRRHRALAGPSTHLNFRPTSD
jgi:hypothetical protein